MMTRRGLLAGTALTLVATPMTGLANCLTGVSPPPLSNLPNGPNAQGYMQVLAEEFSTISIADNGAIWSPDFPWESGRAPPTLVGDGTLAFPLSPSGDTSMKGSWHNQQGGTFFRGGIFETRMKLIPGWNAFWLYGGYHTDGGPNVAGTPTRQTGEIDWFETDSAQPSTAVCTIHTDSDGSNNAPDTQTGGNPDGTRGNNNHSLPSTNLFDGQWHTFGGVWRQDRIEWWIDGVLIGACPPFAENWQFMEIVVGSGVGGVNGGNKTATGNVLVDYIRVWQRPGVDKMLPTGSYTFNQILAAEG